MRLTDLVSKLNERGIYPYIESGKLKTRSEQPITDPQIIKLIKDHKEALIEFLAPNDVVLDAEPITLLEDRGAPSEASYAQQRLWFIDQLEGHSAQYNINIGIELTGQVNLDAIKYALNEIVKRHEILRTTFVKKNNLLLQQVNDIEVLDIQYIDLCGLDEQTQQLKLQDISHNLAKQSFNLAHDMMLRCTVVQQQMQLVTCFFTIHHIASDGWSRAVLMKEFSELYRAYVTQKPANLEQLNVQYRDFAAWQRKALQGETLQQNLNWWTSQLADMPEIHQLPLSQKRPAQQQFVGGKWVHTIKRNTLDILCQAYSVTPFVLLHTVFALWMARYSNESDVVVGTPISGRIHREVEGLVGFFVNTLVLRTQVNSSDSFESLLLRNKNNVLDAFSHQQIPFDMLVEQLQPSRSLAFSPLFQVLFSYHQGSHETPELQLPGVQINALENEDNTNQFDIEFNVSVHADEIHMVWSYNRTLFSEAAVARFARSVEVLLQSAAETPQQKALALALIAPVDHHKAVIVEQSRTDFALIHQYFEHHAEHRSDQIALISDEHSLSYQDINIKANKVAHYLISVAVKPGERVGLCTRRSADMLIGLLGILKAGAAYVPFDWDAPEERLITQLSIANINVILTQSELMMGLPFDELEVLPLDYVDDLLSMQPSNNPQLATCTGEQTAYVIFTSGSTGLPKGVMVSHANVVNYMQYASDEYGLANMSGAIVSVPLTFDAVVTSLLVPWVVGKPVVLLADAMQDYLAQLQSYCRESTPWLFKLTPAHLELLSKNALSHSDTAHHFVVGGEALTQSLAAKCLQTISSNMVIFNEYGPTETTVGCSVYKLTHDTLDTNSVSVPIGVGIANTRIYVMNEQQQLVPEGVVGEIVIAGSGVSQGYLQTPTRPADKFIQDPKHPEDVMYRSGDLGRYLANGELEYVGRVDSQVKLRGFRIELSEIDAVISQSDLVSECCTLVRVRENNDSVIVSYIVPADNFLDTEQEETTLQGLQHTLNTQLRSHSKQYLPEYMQPSVYMFISEIPLTHNGKVDPKALPMPIDSDYEKEVFVAPDTPLEKSLAGIWQSVLHIEQIGIDDNFFSLGGHSLLATQVVSEIAAQLHIDVQVRELFELNTIRSLAQALETKEEAKGEHIRVVNRDQVLPLSFPQRRLWLVDGIDGGSTQYHIDNLLKLDGDVSLAALQHALDSILLRHEILRTNYVADKGQPYQKINAATGLLLDVVELTELEPKTQHDELNRRISAQRKIPFDLAHDLPIRVTLYKLDAQSYVMLLTVHHIAADGWSSNLLIAEFTELYRAYIESRVAKLPTLLIGYADYASWQHVFIESPECAQQIAYWKQQLAHLPVAHSLPLDKPRPATQQFHGGKISQQIGVQVVAKLQQLAQKNNASLFMVLQSAFALLLGRWSNETDVVIGSPIAGRAHKQLEHLVGFFINSLVLRTRLDANPSFVQLLAQNKTMILDAFAHQAVPFDLLVDELKPERSLNHSPVFQVSFTMHNLNDVAGELPHVKVSEYVVDKEQSRYDIELHVTQTPQGLIIRWLYATSLFERQTIERLSQSFATLLNSILAYPERPVQQLSILPTCDIEPLASLQAPHANIQSDCIHRLFESYAQSQPSAIAVQYEDETLSYEALNQAANQLARLLVSQGVKANQLVGLCVERSVETMIGILGILKAGAAYLPIDAEYPEERINGMLDDAQVEIVLTQQSVLENHAVLAEYTTIALDGPIRVALLSQFEHHDISDAELPLSDSNLGYSIYTSGSTGKPKGVQLTHRGMVNLAHNQKKLYSTSAGSKVLSFASLSFDGATFEWLWALTSGATLFIAAQEHRTSADKLSRFLIDNQITHAAIPPALLTQIPQVQDYALEVLIIAGEACEEKLAWQWTKLCRVCNSYGPSENTVAATHKDVIYNEPITLGHVLDNVEVKVTNADGLRQPIGVHGELWLTGLGLSTGYINRPQLNDEKFVVDEQGKRFYKTGDWVKWCNSGELAFLGRMDDQVKIRGFRIELGEIETRLLAHPWVAKTVIVADNSSGVARIVAYVVVQDIPAAEHNDVLLGKTWRAFLKTDLPDYMVPSAFVVIDALPLNTNGKVDKAKLPKPNFQAQQAYVAPSSVLEKQLTTIWQETLRVEQIGVNDNFFENGGDSILAMQVVTRATEQQIEINTKQLFEAQTIAELAKLAGKAEAASTPQEMIMGEVSLLPIHHLFLSEETVDRHHYNQAVLLTVPAEFNEFALQAIIEQLYLRHDALRLRFDLDEQSWHATHCAMEGELITQSCIVENMPQFSHENWVTKRCTYWQRSFNLNKGPLLRAVYFKSSAEQSRLLLVVHHIVVDGVSWRILLNDVQRAYAQWQKQEPLMLGVKTSSYQQWTQAILDYAHSDELQKQSDYWVSQYHHDIAPLPLDKPQTDWGSIGSTATTAIELTTQETKVLLHECNQVYRTKINELLLAGVFLGMRRWTQSSGLRIRLEGHGREALFEQLNTTETVGWFTSVYPLTLISEQSDIATVIKSVKEQYRALPDNGIGYGVLRYLTRDEALLQVCEGKEPELEFNYLGQFDQVINDDTDFDAAPEAVGEKISHARQRMHRIGLSGKVFDGQLFFVLDYSIDNYHTETMVQLAQWIEDGLRCVIHHCQQVQVGDYTPSDFPLAQVEQQQLDAWQVQYPQMDKLYPATPMQTGLLFESMIDPGTYVVQTYPILQGQLNVEAFRQAWQEFVASYDILRTVFVEQGEALHQLVVKQATLPWRFEDWRQLDENQQQTEFAQLLQQDRAIGFDFSQAPLLRITLIQLSDDRFQLLWSQHHAIADGWSIPIIYRDVIALYEQLVKGQITEPLVPVPYEKYMAWLIKQDLLAADTYWRTLMADVTSPTQLSLPKPQQVASPAYVKQSLILSEQQTLALTQLAQSHQTTLNTLLQWAWGFMLNQYCGDNTVVFGATIAGRPAAVAGIESMVGLFINTIPVKVSFAKQQSLASALSELHQQFQQSMEYGYLPLAQVQRMANIPNTSALFDSLLVFENFPIDGEIKESTLKEQISIEVSQAEQQTHYKMTLIVNPNDNLRVEFRYRNSELDEHTVVRLKTQFQRVLQQIATNQSLSLLTDDDVQTQLARTQNEVAYTDSMTLSQGFEQSVAIAAACPALIVGEQTLSYELLNAKANQVAHKLIASGVVPGSWVGLHCTRSVEMVVGILAVIKAGAGYVPLDPSYPRERLRFIAQQTQLQCVLTQQSLVSDSDFEQVTQWCLDDWSLFAKMPTSNIDLVAKGVDGTNKLVALYTSGSTGTPKGVEHTHRSFINVALTMQRHYPSLNSQAAVMHYSTMNFDMSLYELTQAFLSASPLVVVEDEERYELSKLVALIVEHQIDRIYLPTALLGRLAHYVLSESIRLDSLKVIQVAGEQLLVNDEIRQFFAQCQCQLINLYGPTESFVVSHALLDGDPMLWPDVPAIGEAIDNVRLYVLDTQHQFVPLGMQGELYLAGDGLANGYIVQTTEKSSAFCQITLADGISRRMYKTGDLVRWNEAGKLEFIRRIDKQVKIRGFRIEVGEVEVAISNIAFVEDAVVTAQENKGEHYLVAYVVFANAGAQNQHDLLIQLKQVLPHYMLPAKVVELNSLPLNVNGKVDIYALPKVELASELSFVAPKNELEVRLAKLWCEVLKVSQVSTQSSFFELGGHSILAMKLIPMMLKEFDVAISVADLFNYSTIVQQAQLINLLAQHTQESNSHIEPSEELEELEW